MKMLLAFMLAFNIASANAAQPSSFVVDAHCSFAETIKHVRLAAINNNFRIVRERDMSVNGVKIHAIWFCNFAFLNKAVLKHKQVGYLLPFRVTVVEHNGKISVSAANPDRSMELVKSKLGNLCDTITAEYKAILEESTL